MGFKGVELEVRTRAFFTTIAEESFLYEERIYHNRPMLADLVYQSGNYESQYFEPKISLDSLTKAMLVTKGSF
jgi:hypothetical protein